MSNTNEMEQGLDQEGKEVLDQLEKEGFEIAGRAPADPPKPEEKPVEQPIKPEVKPETKSEVKPEEQKPKETTESVKPTITEPKPERKVQHVPLAKYLDTERQLKDALAKVDELSKPGTKPSEQTVTQAQDAVKILEEKFGYDHEEAAKLAEVIKAIVPGQTLSPEQQQALAELNTVKQQLTQTQEKLNDEREEIAFEKDFTAQVLKDFPHLAEHKQTIKEMAYSDDYAKTPLRAVALAFMDAEGIQAHAPDVINGDKPGGGTTRQADTVDFNNLTEEQFNKLTPEQQDQFFAFQDNKERQGRGALNPLK